MSKVRTRVDGKAAHFEYTRPPDSQDKRSVKANAPPEQRWRGFELPLDEAETYLSESLSAVRLALAERAARNA